VYDAEIVPNANKAINYKLWKLEEHLLKIKSGKEFENSKDIHYLLPLCQYVSDSLTLGFIATIDNFKKLKKKSYKH